MRILECPICKKQFKVAGSQARRYCSRPCMSEGYKQQLKGQDNPNYRHGPKLCQYCGGLVSRHAKGNTCINCLGLDRTGEKNSFYGRKHSNATREKMRENHSDVSGTNNYWFGKKLSDERKRQLSDEKKRRWKALSQDEKEKILSDLRRGTERQLREKGGTVPENGIANLLGDLGFHFERNKLLYDKFFVDFLLQDGTVVEVFGDYWHANPAVFPKFNAHQRRQIKKDKARVAYLTKCGHRVIVVWENDIKFGLGAIKERIKNECSSTG